MDSMQHRQIVDALRTATRSEAWSVLQRLTHLPPRFLYKYLSPKSPSIRSLVLDSQLWLASPTAFNDPFEMAVRLTFNGKPAERMNALRLMAKSVEAPWKDRQELARKAFLSDPTDQMNQSHRQHVERFGVACLTSAGARNPLMWSHYSDSHKGLCVSFHLASSPSELHSALPVKYSDEYPVINWVKRPQVTSKLGEALWQKSKVWSYEHEHRIVERNRANTIYQLNPRGVIGLVLGARAAPSLEDEVVDLIQQRQSAGLPRVRVFRAKLSDTQYSIRVLRARDIESRCYSGR